MQAGRGARMGGQANRRAPTTLGGGVPSPGNFCKSPWEIFRKGEAQGPTMACAVPWEMRGSRQGAPQEAAAAPWQCCSDPRRPQASIP